MNVGRCEGRHVPQKGQRQERFTRTRYYEVVPCVTSAGPFRGPLLGSGRKNAADRYCTELSAHAASLHATLDQAASLQATVPQAADAQAASAHAASLQATLDQAADDHAASDQAAVSHVGLASAADRQAVALNTVVPSAAVVR